MSETLPVSLQDTAARKKASTFLVWLIAGACLVTVLLIIFNLPQEDVVEIWNEYAKEPELWEAARNRTLGFEHLCAYDQHDMARPGCGGCGESDGH